MIKLEFKAHCKLENIPSKYMCIKWPLHHNLAQGITQNMRNMSNKQGVMQAHLPHNSSRKRSYPMEIHIQTPRLHLMGVNYYI